MYGSVKIPLHLGNVMWGYCESYRKLLSVYNFGLKRIMAFPTYRSEGYQQLVFIHYLPHREFFERGFTYE